MSDSLAPALLRFLDRNAGQKVTFKDIQKAVSGVGGEARAGGRQSRRRRKPVQRTVARQWIDEILAELSRLGAVDVTARGVQIADPFLLRGRASLSPRGLVFVAVRGADPDAREIFVAPRDSRGALPGDEVLVRLNDRTRERFEGRVVSIARRSREHYRMRLLGDPQRRAVLGQILDVSAAMTATLDVSRIPADSIQRFREGKIVIVTLEGETTRQMGMAVHQARFVRFEDDGDLDPDFARILMKYDLELDYPVDAKNAGEPTPKNVRNWKRRADLRDLYTVTIDGADSKDFDDAISLGEEKGGNVTLYVHVADVSHYVEMGSALDEEARARSTSYYLSNRVVPMLPPELSENLCSLVAGRDRLAFTAKMEIALRDGQIKKSEFMRSVIRVDKRLTYTGAEDMLRAAEKSPAKNNPAKLVSDLWDLAQKQKRTRMERGRIDLDIPEATIRSNDKNEIEEITYRERLRSNMLIEECMLSANTAVAKFLREHRARALYRVHEPMDERKLENLNVFFQAYNIPFELKDSSYRSIGKATEMVRGHVGADGLERIFNLSLLRSFMQASYRADPLGHWGLGFSDYCHFTSPIRRYPDLVVHRALGAILERAKQPYSEDETDELAIHTSERERIAMEAERDISRLKVLRYIEQKKMKRFRGFITGFKFDRVFLELDNLPAEAIVQVQHLTDERELLMPDRFSAFIKKLGRPAVQGEEWNLELERIDPEEMRLYCRPVFARS